MKNPSWVLLCLLVFLVNTPAFAQVTDPVTAIRTPQAGDGHSYIGTATEAVNPADGSLTLTLPLSLPPSRGFTMPFGIRYNSSASFALQSDLNTVWLGGPTSSGAYNGWSFNLPALTFTTSVNAVAMMINPIDNKLVPKACDQATAYTFHNMDGKSTVLQLTGFFDDPNLSGLNCSSPSVGASFTHGVRAVSSAASWPTLPSVTVTDQDGTVYSFSQQPTVSTQGQQNASPPESWIVYPTAILDRNGNQMVRTSLTPTLTYADTMGRQAVSIANNGSVPTTMTISGYSKPVTLGWSTGTQQLSSTVALYPNAAATPYSACSVIWRTRNTTPIELISIELPNNTVYALEYASNGLINKITYPDGGYVRYEWGTSAGAVELAYMNYSFLGMGTGEILVQQVGNPFSGVRTGSGGFSGGGTDMCTYTYQPPVITDRFVSFDGANEVLSQHFEYSTTLDANVAFNSLWDSKSTTVTTNDLQTGKKTITVYNYVPAIIDTVPNTRSWRSLQTPVEASIIYEDGNGTELRRENKSWFTSTLQAADQSIPDGNTSHATSRLFTYDQNDQLTDRYDYDFAANGSYSGDPSTIAPNGGSTPGSSCSTGSIVSAAPPNYAGGPYYATASGINAGAIGPLLRHSATQYQDFGCTHMFDRPKNVSVMNASNTTLSSTSYTFTDSVTSSGLGIGVHSWFVGPPASRGNVQSATTWLNTAPTSSPMTSYTWYDTGLLASKTDPCGNSTCSDVSGSSHTTSYTYGGSTAGYLTGVAFPTTNGIAHTQSFEWDYSSGLLTSSTDQNNQTTNYAYDDSLLRLTEIQGPPDSNNSGLRPTTVIKYDDTVGSPGVTISNLIDANGSCSATSLISGRCKTTVSTRDGMGHVVSSEISSDPSGADIVDTAYDGLGRVLTKSNPHRSDTPSSVSYNYDALGRIVRQTNQDGTSTSTAYSANTTTFTNESGNQWVRASDALGRLINVKEPNGASSSASMVTSYQYDLLGNLTSAVQQGLGSGTVSRLFSYNSLSQLISANNPESASASVPARLTCSGTTGLWAICYTYDASGNVSSKTDNRQFTTSYFYDALNRLTKKTYSDGTTLSAAFGYDGLDSSGNAISGLLNTVGRMSYDSNLLNAAATYSYDTAGHVLKKALCLPGDCTFTKAITNSFDLAGDVTSLQHPPSTAGPSTGILITYGYDSAQHLISLQSNWHSDALHPTKLFDASSTSQSAPGYGPFGLLNANLGILDATQEATATLARGYDARMRLVSQTDRGRVYTPSGTTSSGSISISGSEQGPVYPSATKASATITVSGSDRVQVFYPCGTSFCPATIPDVGTVTVIISGTSVVTNYGNQTSQNLASAITAAINGASVPATATVSGNVITLTAKTAGTSGNSITLNASCTTTQTSYYSGCSFSLARTSFSGGAQGTAVYDTGTISATINGKTATASFAAGSTTQSIASSLLASIQTANASVLQASLSGSTINLQSIATGTAVNWTIGTSVTFNSTNFSSPSFTVASSGMSGGSTTPSWTQQSVYSYQATFSGTSNLTTLNDSVLGQWTYGYDTLNRLTSASASSGSWSGVSIGGGSLTWTYDAFGNRTGQQVVNSTVFPTQWATFQTSGAVNNQAIASNYATGGISYDAAGDVTYDGRNQYLYDAEGRICAVSTAGSIYGYVYDAEGNRVAKRTLSSLTCTPTTGTFTWTNQYVVGSGGEQLDELNGSNGWIHTNVFINGEIFTTYSGSDTNFALTDWLGTKRVQINVSGIVNPYWSLPFGDFLLSQGSASDATEHHYTGKERDSESGNDYFGARYYNSAMGSWLSPDPGPSHPTNPQSWNRYIYGANNPLGNIDPDGQEPVKAQAGTAEGFRRDMNATRHHVGAQTGVKASAALSSLGETSWSNRGPGPANTGVFNMSSNRYIYTTGYGWVDMVHFLFYAGRAYNYEQKGDKNPEGHAIQDGYKQEAADSVFDSWSAYSYEDLPSDKLGAMFAVFVFDPTSQLSLGEQIEAFLKGLGATDPTTAPNYDGIPNADSHNPPTARNTGTSPMYTSGSHLNEDMQRQCALGNKAACN